MGTASVIEILWVMGALPGIFLGFVEAQGQWRDVAFHRRFGSHAEFVLAVSDLLKLLCLLIIVQSDMAIGVFNMLAPDPRRGGSEYVLLSLVSVALLILTEWAATLAIGLKTFQRRWVLGHPMLTQAEVGG